MSQRTVIHKLPSRFAAKTPASLARIGKSRVEILSIRFGQGESAAYEVAFSIRVFSALDGATRQDGTLLRLVRSSQANVITQKVAELHEIARLAGITRNDVRVDSVNAAEIFHASYAHGTRFRKGFYAALTLKADPIQ
jgi:hypothetical protein